MNAQRSLGFALVVLQAAALACCFGTTLFSAAAVVIAAIGWLSTFRPIPLDRLGRWVIALALMYIVQRSFIPPEWYSGVRSFFFSGSCLIAEYFLAFQVVEFFVRRRGDNLPAYLPALALVTMTFAGDFQATERTRLIFQAFSIGLLALTAGFFAACRRGGAKRPSGRPAGRAVLLACVLIGSGVLGWAAASHLFRYARQIEMFLGAAINPPTPPQSAGFSGRGRLGSIAEQKSGQADRVALRVYADRAPGYLRGRAFDTCQGSEWRTAGQWAALSPEADPTTGENGRVRTFSLADPEDEAGGRMEIWPNQSFGEVVFAPQGLAALEIAVDRLSTNMHGIVQADDLPAGEPYAARTVGRASPDAGPLGTSPSAPPAVAPSPIFPPVDWDLLVSLPDDLDPRIAALAERVAGRAGTAGEKIAAVERYFLDNYQYRFGIEIPPGRDPLTHFLLERPPAHCEFFASGAAVLLRCLGVPSRYVTGFVAAERNGYGDYWVARNRDAHAWVEAFDPQRGWVLVEATPANGLPQETPASAAGQFWDSLRARWQRLVAAVRRDGLAALFGMLKRQLVSPWVLALLLLASAAVAVLRIRGRRGAIKPRRQLDPLLIRMGELLRAMDLRLRKAAVQRRPGETLHQFADRIARHEAGSNFPRAAEWYRRFAAVRYGGPIEEASVEMLAEALPDAAASSRRLREPATAAAHSLSSDPAPPGRGK